MSQVSGSARIISPGPAASKETSEGPGGRPSDTGHSQFPTPDLFWKLLLLFCLTFSHSRSTGPLAFFFFYFYMFPLSVPLASRLSAVHFLLLFIYYGMPWYPQQTCAFPGKRKEARAAKRVEEEEGGKLFFAFAPRAPSAGALVSSVGPRFHLRIVLGYLPLLCKPYYFFMRSHAKLMGSLAFPPRWILSAV